MPELRSIIASNVCKLRARTNLTQEDMAGVLGVSRQTYLSWEKADTPIPSDKLIIIAKAFHLPISMLFEEDLDGKQLLYM